MKLIAVVLPQIYKGGVLRGVISFLKKIQSKSDNKYKFTFFVLSLEEYTTPRKPNNIF